MNYGLYLSAAGAQSATHRQDVLANNLANLHTVGFKPDFVVSRQRLPERVEESGSFADPKLLLERLGGGLLVEPTRMSREQGALTKTDGVLDLAIEGDGLFVVGPRGNPAPEEIRLTRDGRFVLNGDGILVSAASAMPVLDAEGRAIRLDASGQIEVDADGTIRQDGSVVARLRLVEAPADALTKLGDNALLVAGGAARAARCRVRQGFVEESAVDPIATLNDMISASKAANANMKMMQYHDHALGQVFNTYARVS